MKVLNLLVDLFIFSWFLSSAIIFIISGEVSKITVICSFIIAMSSYLKDIVEDYRKL